MKALVLNTETDWHELRFTLRGIDKFGDFEEVFIAGHAPDWLQNITHIPFEDGSDPYASSTEKVATAIEIIGPTDLVVFHDDIYLLEPYVPVKYYLGTLKDRAKRTANHRQLCMLHSLQALGEDTLNYCLHYPMPIRTAFVIRNMRRLVDRFGSFSWMSYFGAVNDGFPRQQKADNKIYRTPSKFRPDEIAFSSAGESDDLLEFFLGLYPEKSSFETNKIK